MFFCHNYLCYLLFLPVSSADQRNMQTWKHATHGSSHMDNTQSLTLHFDSSYLAKQNIKIPHSEPLINFSRPQKRDAIWSKTPKIITFNCTSLSPSPSLSPKKYTPPHSNARGKIFHRRWALLPSTSKHQTNQFIHSSNEITHTPMLHIALNQSLGNWVGAGN